MGGRDCAGVFRCFVFILCNALFLFSTNQRLDEFAVVWALSVLAWSVLLSSTALRFLCCIFVMLDLQDEGSSKQTCMVCVSPFHQNPVVNRDPTFLKPINRSAG